MRTAALAVLGLFAMQWIGCGPGKGEQLADRIHEKMVEKIQKGEIKEDHEIPLAQVSMMFEAMKEIGIDEGTMITQSDEQAMKEKLDRYENEWKQMLAKAR